MCNKIPWKNVESDSVILPGLILTKTLRVSVLRLTLFSLLFLFFLRDIFQIALYFSSVRTMLLPKKYGDAYIGKFLPNSFTKWHAML